MAWIRDNLHDVVPTDSLTAGTVIDTNPGALCATGNSGGAAQISYMLSHYGLGKDLAAVVPTGGPPMGRLDLGCIRDDPANEPLWFGPGSSKTIDSGFGFGDDVDGEGPCAQGLESFRPQFQDASIAFDGNFVHPETMVWFVFGENDTSNAVDQGKAFYEKLLEEGSPRVELSIAPNTSHGTPNSSEGADTIRDILLKSCRLR